MEEQEGGLNFDFEGGLETTIQTNHQQTNSSSLQQQAQQPQIPTDSHFPQSLNQPQLINTNNNNFSEQGQVVNINNNNNNNIGGGSRRSFRQTVCRHWLRGLCMKGDACGFLHQYDKARMPVCRFFRLYGECREQDCVYKHTNEEVKECNMYRLGFCPNGPDCRYRHAKLPGPPPPVEEVFQKIQHLSSGTNSRFFQPRNGGYGQQAERYQVPQGSSMVNQGFKQSTTAESAIIQQQQPQIPQPPEQQVNQTQLPNLPDGQGNRMASPLPPGLSRFVQSF